MDGISLGQARECLGELYDQHLVTEPAPGRYQLHDLVREHARTLTATDDPAETDAALQDSTLLSSSPALTAAPRAVVNIWLITQR